MSSPVEMTKLVAPERKRTYHFPGGKLVLENVVAVAAPPGRSHRLETADGRKWIVPLGWMGIELDMDEWTF